VDTRSCHCVCSGSGRPCWNWMRKWSISSCSSCLAPTKCHLVNTKTLDSPSKRSSMLTNFQSLTLGNPSLIQSQHCPTLLLVHFSWNSQYFWKTSFNQLDLPCYEDKETLQKKLLQAILEGNEGFGIAWEPISYNIITFET